MRMVDDENPVFQWEKVSLGCWTTRKVLLVLKELNVLRHIPASPRVGTKLLAAERHVTRESLLAYGCRYNTRLAHAVQVIIMKHDKLVVGS
jgi:hypothetical protein